MRVVVASTFVPFVDGGASFMVDWLEQMLLRRGHEVETLRIPFDSHYPELLDQMLALRLLDVTAHGDRLIAIRTPSYLLRHPAKVLWFIHHHRGAYDLWGTPYQDIPGYAGAGGASARRLSAPITWRSAKPEPCLRTPGWCGTGCGGSTA